MQKLSRNVAKLDTTALNKLVGEYYNTNTNYDRKKEIKKLIDNFKWN